MDDDAALAFLREFLARLDVSKSIYQMDTERYYALPQWQEQQDLINAMLPSIRLIGEQVDASTVPQLASQVSMYTWEWVHARTATNQLIGSIELREHVDGILGPTGPRLAATDLHPWVWSAAAGLWDDGHRRAAIQTAASSVEAQLRGKVVRYDGSASDVVTQAFRLDGTGRRLRFADLREGSDDYRSAHEGAMSFGRGCFLAIRNRSSHGAGEVDEQVALEQLAGLSVLARWIDAADVVDT